MPKLISTKYNALLKSFNENTDWFDEDLLDMITKVKYTPFALSEKEWEDLYLHTDNNEEFLSFLIEHKDCPYSIIEKIASSPISEKIADKILAVENLKDKEIEVLLNKQGLTHITSMLHTGIERGKCPYSRNVIEYIIDSKKSYNFAELAYTSNTSYIKSLIEENPENETMMQMIANNQNISEKIRDKAFDNCDWNGVYFKTEHMNKLIYQSIVQTVFDLKFDKDIGYKRQEMFEKLVYKISRKELPESCQIDLVNRCNDISSTEHIELLSTLANVANSKLILDMIWDKGVYKLKTLVAENENSSNEHKMDMMKKYMAEYTPKNPYIVSQLTDKMAHFINKAVLTKEMYEELLYDDNFKENSQIRNSIINSPLSLINVLSKLSNSEKIDDISREQTKISLICRERGLHHFIGSIKSTIGDYYYRYETIKDIPHDKLLEQKYVNYAQYFSDITIDDKKEFDYILSVLDKIKEESKNPIYQSGIEFYKKCLEKYYNRRVAIKNADKIFKEIIAENGKTMYNLIDFEDVRNIKEFTIKKQASKLDKTSLVKINNLIEQKCKFFGATSKYNSSPRDIISAHLAIEGYADLYNTVKEELRERMLSKDKEESKNGIECDNR